MKAKYRRINWRFKAFMFKLISLFRLYRLPLLLSKNLTGRGEKILSESFDNDLKFHYENIKSCGARKAIEIGAGRSLIQNIFISRLGISQTVIDRFFLIDFALVSKAASLFHGKKTNITDSLDLHRRYSIKYCAPFEISELVGSSERYDFFLQILILKYLQHFDSLLLRKFKLI